MNPGAALPGQVCVRAAGVRVSVPLRWAPAFEAFEPSREPAEATVTAAGLEQLVSEFTAAVVERTPHLGVHAAVVHSAAGAVVIPGPSGMGKSTLTAALVGKGFALMSDEMAVIDRVTADVESFPRPITLVPAGGADEVALDPAHLGSIGPRRCRVGVLVVAERDATTTPARALDEERGVGLAALIRHSFNHFRDPVASLQALSAVVSDAHVVRLRYSEAGEAAETLAALIGRLGPVAREPKSSGASQVRSP